MHSIFQMSAYDITTDFSCLGNTFFLETCNKPSKQDCFLLMHGRCKWAGCQIYQGRVGERLFWWNFMEKGDISPMFGMVIDWTTNLIKSKNAFVNLREFSRWDYKVSYFTQSVSEMLFSSFRKKVSASWFPCEWILNYHNFTDFYIKLKYHTPLVGEIV